MKKILAVLMCIVCVLTLFSACGGDKKGSAKGLPASEPVKSDQNKNYKFDVYADYTVITAYIGEDFRVSVPSRLGGKPVRGIGDEAIGSSMLAIEVVDIPASVTYVSPSAFSRNTTIKAFTVSASNPSYKSVKGIIFSKDEKTILHYPAGTADESYTIPDGTEAVGDYAFAENEHLQKVTFSKQVTSVGAHAFEKCSKLYQITMPKGVTEIGDYAFYECTALPVKTLPDGVVKIGAHAFDYCQSIQTMTLPDAVAEIGDCAFYKCKGLREITLSKSLTKYGHRVFAGCALLENITLAPGNEQYREVNGVLFTMDGKTLVEYPYGKYQSSYVVPDGVTAIRADAFFYCYEDVEENEKDSLSKIDLNAVESIGANAFANRTRLQKIELPPTVKTLSPTAFYQCTGIQAFESSGVQYVSQKGVLFTKDKKTIVAYPIGKKDTAYTIPKGVAHIGDYAFSFNITLKTIVFAESIQTVGNYAFYESSTFGSIVTFTDQLKSIGKYAFSHCFGIEKFEFADNTITEIAEGTFEVLDGAYEFVIPRGVTKIGKDAFRESGYLSYIEIPDTVTQIDDRAFYDMDDLHNLTIPASVKTFGKEIVSVYAATDPDRVTLKVTSGSAAEQYAKENNVPYEVK